jgi:hypothetical protein
LSAYTLARRLLLNTLSQSTLECVFVEHTLHPLQQLRAHYCEGAVDLQIDKMFDTSDELGMGQDAPCVEKRPALKPKNVYKGGRKSQLKANRVARLTHGKRKRDREGKGRVHIRLAVLLVFEKGRNTEFD